MHKTILSFFLSSFMVLTGMFTPVFAEEENTDLPAEDNTSELAEQESLPEESDDNQLEDTSEINEDEEPAEEESGDSEITIIEQDDSAEEDGVITEQPEDTETADPAPETAEGDPEEEIIEEAEDTEELMFRAVQLGAVGTKTEDDSGSDPGLSGSNIDANNYSYHWAHPIYSYISALDNGYMLVDYHNSVLKVLYYNDDHVLQKTITLTGGLPLFGGFYETEDWYFIVTGQNNPDESADVECYRITKYDKNWNEIGSVGMYDCNTYIPFSAGSCRMADSGQYLLIRTCHEMYMSSDGYHHQANVAIQLNMDDMTLSQAFYGVWNISNGYVSHSFNQFILADNDHMIGLDHGDAYPRGFVVTKYRSAISSGTFGNVDYNTFMSFVGSTGANRTNAEIGGFEMSSTHYLIAGTSAHQADTSEVTRNIFIGSVDRSNLSSSTVNWVTSFEEDGTKHVTVPVLTDLGNDTFLVMWSEADGKTHDWNSQVTISYVLVDHAGNLLTDVQNVKGLMSDCTPVVKNNKAVWYTQKNNDVIFFELDFNNQSISQNYAKTKNWIELDSLSLNETEAEMMVGQSLTLATTFDPENATDQKITYASEDTGIATVSSTGSVRAAAEGETTISVTARNGRSAECKITVLPKLTISRHYIGTTLYIGTAYDYSLVIEPAEYQSKVKYTSSDPSVASIDAEGQITPHKEGNVSFTAQIAQTKYTQNCTVKFVPVTSVSLNRNMQSINVGESGTLTATVRPTNASDKSVVWSSSDPSVVTVDENGNLQAKNGGSADITVTTNDGGFTATCKVTVIVPVTGIQLEKDKIELPINTNTTLTVTVLPENATNKTITWASSDSSVVYIYNNILYGRKIGTATVTAKSNNGITAECIVTVTNPATRVTLNYSSRNMVKGGILKLTATVYPTNADDTSVTWSSDNEQVASVDNNGQITAKKTGQATVTVSTVNGKTAQCVISVTNPVTGVSFKESSGTLPVGGTDVLTPIVTPADADSTTYIWSSNNTGVATVDENGTITAVKKGTAKITVTTANGKTAVYTLTVTNPATKITLNKTSGNLKKNEMEQLTATVTPSDADDRTVTWTSADTSVATVSKTGLVTAKKTGTTVITAKTVNGLTAEYQVTVTNPAVSLKLDKTELRLESSSTYTLSAAITPSDADDKTITWSVSDKSIATVDQNGKVTAVKKGTATVTAELANGLQAQCTVHVLSAPTGLTIDPEDTTVVAKKTASLRARTVPDELDGYTFSWQSSDPTIVSVNNQGVITGLKVGKTTVTVTSRNNLKGSCDVRVLFEDVANTTMYYYDAVYWAVDNAITQGNSPTTFNPSGFCKRYQFVLFLWRQAGKPEPTLKTDPFTDVTSDPNKDAYEKAVLWAAEKGYTTGTTPTTFDPYAPLTRGQVVTFLYRVAGEPEVTTTVNPFRDVSEGKYYYKPVLWAVEKEITTGVKPDQFQPTATCTRGQTVVFMQRQFQE